MQSEKNGNGGRPKVAAHYLLEKMRQAGVEKGFVILRDGKWDIPAYFGNGDLVGMNLAYLVARHPYGPPFTIDEAYPFVRHARIAFGFPDILFEPTQVYAPLLDKLESSGADVVLAVFPLQEYEHHHLIEMDRTGRIRNVLLTREESSEQLSWVAAVWRPSFTDFLHQYACDKVKMYRSNGFNRQDELHIPDVLQSAIDSNLYVDSVSFSQGSYLDIGTIDNLIKTRLFESSLSNIDDS